MKPQHVTYMDSFGIDPACVSTEGFNSTGYWEFDGYGDEEWRMWPHSFDYGHFVGLILAWGFEVARLDTDSRSPYTDTNSTEKQSEGDA